MTIKPFCVSTCENRATNEQSKVLVPTMETPFEPFLIQDPFGLRKAIVPVFRRNINGEIYGRGTAFHIDGWGTFLTADHVIEFVRKDLKSATIRSKVSPSINSDHIFLLLGMGLVFDISDIPEEAFALVERVSSHMVEKDDPLTNRVELANSVDLAAMTAIVQSKSLKVPHPHFVPVKGANSCPSVGETVLAIGFPELENQRLDPQEQRILLKEGMYGAYGRVTAVRPEGISKLNRTPVFEVECNWRSGMSGGPVFNSSGEVVGLVSRGMELSPDNSDKGIGWATCFELLPNFNKIVPTLDILNPTYRRGWAVLRNEPWHLAGFFKSKSEAQQLKNSVEDDYQIKYGTNVFGTDSFIY